MVGWGTPRMRSMCPRLLPQRCIRRARATSRRPNWPGAQASFLATQSVHMPKLHSALPRSRPFVIRIVLPHQAHRLFIPGEWIWRAVRWRRICSQCASHRVGLGDARTWRR
jgi:hypothetical protein